MSRAEVEARLAGVVKATGRPSLYADNLQGGIVSYAGERCDLLVEYNAGAPAPAVSTPKGILHLPPTDETVKSIEVVQHSPS